MAKELPFFKFEVSEWAMGRIQKQPLETQGAFINLCCKYWHKLGELSWEDACLDFGDSHIEALERNKIIGRDQDFIYIKFLDKQLDDCQDTSNKNRIAGLKSAAARAKRKSTPVERPLTSVERKSTEEIRKEEKREDKKDAPQKPEYSYASAFAKVFNKPYPKERGMRGEGQDIDMILAQLDKSRDWLEQAKALRRVYDTEGWSMPTNPATIVTSLLGTDWVERLKDSDPERKAERKHGNITGELPALAPANKPGALDI